MRYLAQRISTGEWLDRDLPLSQVQRTRELSGPGSITATIDPELRTLFADDGMRVLEEWATILYAAEDDGQIRNAGLVVPSTTYDGDSTQLVCPGFTSYPHGFIYDSAHNWGPAHLVPATKKNIEQPAIPRPDPLQIVQDHWSYIQSQPDCDLGVSLVGNLSSSVRIGDYNAPYRLRWWDSPDLGQEIDTLAQQTPFDYVEEHSWADDAHTQVDHRVRLGWPRLGKRRDDLRFAVGENITAAIPATTDQEFANHVIGIGNGTGSGMTYARSTVRDGRLRVTKVVTDKTIKDKGRMQALVRATRERMQNTLDIASVSINDHPNARISSIEPGDDIYVQTYIPSYGDLAMWVRVLAITQDENSHAAVLTTQRSSSFNYSSTTQVSV